MSKDLPFYIHSSLDDYGLTPDEFRIVCRIARRDVCTESAPNMAKALKMSDSTVRRVIHFLVECNVVEEKSRIGDTAVRQVRPVLEWIDPAKIEAIRKASIRYGKPKATPVTDTGVVAVTGLVTDTGEGGHTDRGVRSEIQGTPVTDTAKGTPPKVLPEVTPLRDRERQRARDLDTAESVIGNPAVVYWFKACLKKVGDANYPYKPRLPGSVSIDVAEKISAKVTDLDAWRAAVDFWSGNNYQMQNVMTILERYEKEIEKKAAKNGHGARTNGNGHYKSATERQAESITATVASIEAELAEILDLEQHPGGKSDGGAAGQREGFPANYRRLGHGS